MIQVISELLNQRYTFNVMRYRFSFSGDGSPEDLTPSDLNDDQRARPRTGPIEKIADIAYDALRKHDIEVPSDKPAEK